MLKKYYVILPSIPGSIEEEWKQCLDQVLDIRNSGFLPVKINMFTDLPDFQTFKKVRQRLIDITVGVFGAACPTLSITVHPPGMPWKVIIEASFIVEGTAEVIYKFHNSIPYVIIDREDGKELWAGGLSSYMHPGETRIAAEKAFEIIGEILAIEKMTANSIVRQWNYIGNILQTRNNLQNYQIFNEVRSEFYGRYRTVKGYPAATGVGMKHGGVIIDICAFHPADSASVVTLSNPNQTNAYEYSQQVLKGYADKGGSLKNPPQFERALLITGKKHSTVFISGTASILGQVTVGAGDIEQQTIVTIENILRLLDPARIGEFVPDLSLPVEHLSLLRVYIKLQTDFTTVRQMCERFFPGIPGSYVISDICRDDLLVEIEGVTELEAPGKKLPGRENK